MMPFTEKDAREMVGGSTDWRIGLEASILKWEQIAGGDENSYPRDSDCGICFVAINRRLLCHKCPAYHNACGPRIHTADPQIILCRLREIDFSVFEEKGGQP